MKSRCRTTSVTTDHNISSKSQNHPHHHQTTSNNNNNSSNHDNNNNKKKKRKQYEQKPQPQPQQHDSMISTASSSSSKKKKMMMMTENLQKKKDTSSSSFQLNVVSDGGGGYGKMINNNNNNNPSLSSNKNTNAKTKNNQYHHHHHRNADTLDDCLAEMEQISYYDDDDITTNTNEVMATAATATYNDGQQQQPVVMIKNWNDTTETSTSTLLDPLLITAVNQLLCDPECTIQQQQQSSSSSQQQQNSNRGSERHIEKILNWNSAMNQYSTSTTSSSSNSNSNHHSNNSNSNYYTPGLLPSFDLELIRHFHIQSLSKFILDVCSPYLKMPSFERWLLDSKLEQQQTTMKKQKQYHNQYQQQQKQKTTNYDDPVLPYFHQLYSLKATERLIEEIYESHWNYQQQKKVSSQQSQQQQSNNNMNDNTTNQQNNKKKRLLLIHNEAKQMVKELCMKTKNCLIQLQQQHTLLSKSSCPMKKGDRIVLEKIPTTNSSTIDSNPHSFLSSNHDDTNTTTNHNHNSNENNNKNPPPTTTTNHTYTNTKKKSISSLYYTLVYHRDKKWKKPFCIRINATHYEKLKRMFLWVHNEQPKMSTSSTKKNQKNSNSINKSTTTVLQFYNEYGKPTQVLHCFHYIVMVLLIRYSSLSGGQLLLDLKGGGMQGAVQHELFHVLRECFTKKKKKQKNNNNNNNNNNENEQQQQDEEEEEEDAVVHSDSSSSSSILPMYECFGSPFNAYLFPSFGSAFYHDLDWHFGSMGNFLINNDDTYNNNNNDNDDNDNDGTFNNNNNNSNAGLLFTEGCCEANPPFSPGIMIAMSKRIQSYLDHANQFNRSLTFVVIIPNAPIDDTDTTTNNGDKIPVVKRFGGIALRSMVRSEHCTYHFILHAKEHGYIEGAQHFRPTRYKESLYDTSIILLQSMKAREEYWDHNNEMTNHHQDDNDNDDDTTNTNHNTIIIEKIRTAFISKFRVELNERSLIENNKNKRKSI